MFLGLVFAFPLLNEFFEALILSQNVNVRNDNLGLEMVKFDQRSFWMTHKSMHKYIFIL